MLEVVESSMVVVIDVKVVPSVVVTVEREPRLAMMVLLARLGWLATLPFADLRVRRLRRESDSGSRSRRLATCGSAMNRLACDRGSDGGRGAANGGN